MHVRVHPLDGALLYFDRESGTHVRLEGPAYAHTTRRAPRVVQFGLTNRCNLRCSFCFRDTALASTWTAAEILVWAKELAERGVLEIGFGQGEPLVFPEFTTLVRTLAHETPLAINFTTNGLRLDDARLDEFEAGFGQVRLSYYDDNDPLVRVRLLARRKARFGVNLLVTPALLSGLNATIEGLVDAGCRDVLLLGYNGPDASLHLAPEHDRRLARIILDLHARHGQALAIGLSVCFGRRLFEVPQFLVSEDCGAGDDFLTIDSQKRMLACSFHAQATPVESATEVLDVWRTNRANRRHAGLDGCARARLPLARATSPTPSATPRVLVWQAFASNHSTSYTRVGEFSTAAKSEQYVAWVEALLERCRIGPEHDRPAPQNLWQVLGREGEPPESAYLASPRDLGWYAPETILAGGRRVFIHADSTLHKFEIFRHELLGQHGRVLWSGNPWGSELPLVFGVEAGSDVDLLARRFEKICEQQHVWGTRLYGLVPSHNIEYAAPILRTQIRSVACVHETDETLAAALVDPPDLPGRKRRVEWTLIEQLPADLWERGLADFSAHPNWPHPFRMPDQLDAYPLLGSTIVRSEGAPFPAALQSCFGARYMQIVEQPRVRVRVTRRTREEEPEQPFHGLLPKHIAALSRPGGSFVVKPYRGSVDILPRNPAATFAQLEAILGDERYLDVGIMAERPLADALARINADLDAAATRGS